MNDAPRAGVGVLHPGAMGASVGAALVARGAYVRWASDGRSDSTRRRAADAGLVECADLAELVASVGTVISVCPPEAALDTARAVAAAGFTGLYVDANAIAPATSLRVAAVIEEAGAAFVDGAIVGGPPSARGDARLFLSGARADEVAARFEASTFDAIVLGEGVGTASALKVAFAAWTKGSAALLLAVRAFARSEGIDAVLLDEWTRSQPQLAARSSAVARSNAGKAWRFVAEMNEEADAFAAAGLPDGFARAAACVYERAAGFKDVDDPDPDAVFDAIREYDVTERARIVPP